MVLQLDGTLEEIREQLNPEEYPETVACIDSMQDEDFGGLYELASELVNCDKTKTMPQFLFDFIVFLYKECIQDDDDRAMCDLGALYYMGRNGESGLLLGVEAAGSQSSEGHLSPQGEMVRQ